MKLDKSKKIELASMTLGGTTPDGQAAMFEFESQAGKKYKFSAPHEAINEIIGNLEILAEAAWKARGSPNEANVIEGTPGRAKTRSVTGFRFSYAKEGLVVSIICGPVKYEILLNQTQCTEFRDALDQSSKMWGDRNRPN